MNIQVSSTPNALARKFTVTGAGPKPFSAYENLHVNYQNLSRPAGDNRSLNDARNECPMAADLIGKDGVFSVMFDQGRDGSFITVGILEKDKPLWEKYQQAATNTINAHLQSGKPVFTPKFKPTETQDAYHARVLKYFRDKKGSEGTRQIEPVLTAIQALSPYIKQDGGNLKFKAMNLKTGEIFVEMTGACTGCSQTGDTLGNIESALRENFGMNVKIINTATQPNRHFDNFIL
jgi:Fe-S cluster biogenesis protein NfuA